MDTADGHRYEAFLLPDELRRYARDAGLEVDTLTAYHGFWTLFAEEKLANRLPRFVYPFLRWLDYPLISREHGNGFLARMRKSR